MANTPWRAASRSIRPISGSDGAGEHGGVERIERDARLFQQAPALFGLGLALLGEIDIDSDQPAAFGDADRNLLEAVAAALAPRLAGTQ